MNEMKSTIESIDEVDDVMKPMSIGDANNNISIISISFKMMKSLLKKRSIVLILLTSCSLVLFILLSSNKYSSSSNKYSSSKDDTSIKIEKVEIKNSNDNVTSLNVDKLEHESSSSSSPISSPILSPIKVIASGPTNKYSSSSNKSSSTNPLDRRSNLKSLRIVQYNTEWLFIDYYENSKCPGNGCTWKTESEAKIHLSYVVNVINKLNPDIINLCEIKGYKELNYLLESNISNDYKPYIKQGKDIATGQNVGILTKVDPFLDLYRTEERLAFPMPNSKCGYVGTPGTTGVSKHYITEYAIGNMKIAMIGAHLLAIPTDQKRCAEREAQASILQSIIYQYILKKYEIIMLGDLNDFDENIVDANNNIPNSQVLDILKGKSISTQKEIYKLYSIAQFLQQNTRYTSWHDKNKDCKSSPSEFSMIDHILVSDTIKNKITNAFIYQEYDEYCGTYNSDHYPVVIDIDTAL